MRSLLILETPGFSSGKFTREGKSERRGLTRKSLSVLLTY